jgi:hypothetical protein
MNFHSLTDTKCQGLLTALRDNAYQDRAIRMDGRDTSFLGSADA